MPTINQKRIWITWEKQIRNKTLSSAVGARLFEIITAYPRYVRYPVNIYKTIIILFQHKPEIIFVQNPSMVLACLAVIAGKITSTQVVVDAHNAGVLPLDGKSGFLNKLALALIKYTDITLVSNRYLSEYVNKHGGRALIMPDPLPDFKIEDYPHKKTTNKEILFICTWASDEPYADVIKAAKSISRDIKIYITGNYINKLDIIRDDLSENVILTGYLSDSDYKSMIGSCDIVIDLTNRENCLVCGAYEAVAMRKPLILSDTAALREYFNKGAIYTKNDAKNIAVAIETAYQNLDRIKLDVAQLKLEIENSWPDYLRKLECALQKSDLQ